MFSKSHGSITLDCEASARTFTWTGNSRPSGLISLSIRIRKKGAALPSRSYLYDRCVERCDERFGWALSQRHLVKTWSPALLLFVSMEVGSTAVQTVAPTER